ncbi:M48 family metalloprotease [Streptomyces sp. URMC 123]|uniref:M48 family metalloprotease n=1 Tax=Streptomyces sp. URMC 123 TaxID=3423403 RepID=UPI003F1CB56C
MTSRGVLARGTTLHFLMLLCVMSIACVSMINATVSALRAESSFRECVRVADLDLNTALGRAALWTDSGFADCRLRLEAEGLRFSLLGTALLAGAALLLYWCLPRWRRRRLVPVVDRPGARPCPALGRALPATLVEHLDELTRRSRLARRPDFVMDPSRSGAGAYVFGRAGRYTVCLYGGLVACRARDRRTFEAVVLHELAHLRNRDVDITYLTVALWRCFLSAVLIPYVLLQSGLVAREWLGAESFHWSRTAPGVEEVLFSAFLVALVLLARADVLRSRELVADFDAVSLGADPAVWAARSSAGPGRPATGARAAGRAAAQWFRRLWRTHPDWTHRHQSLTRTLAVDSSGSTLRALLFFGAVLALAHLILNRTESQTWPPWATAVGTYLLAPLLVGASLFVLPPRDPYRVPVAPPATVRDDAPEHARRRARRRWGALLVAGVVGALFGLDPLGVLNRDGPPRAAPFGTVDALPPAYRPAPLPRWNEADRAAVDRWFEDGGRRASDRIGRALDAEVSAFAAAAPGTAAWRARSEHCAEVRRALGGARSLPAHPESHGRSLWEDLLKAVEKAGDTLCGARPGRGPGTRSNAGPEAPPLPVEIQYATARMAHATFRMRSTLMADALPRAR